MSELPERIRPARKEDPVRASQVRFFSDRKARRAQCERENLLNAFRGLPERATQATTRPPAKLGSAMVRLMGVYRSPAPSFEKLLAQQWHTVIGDARDAEQCALQYISDDGSLVIAVADAVLRSELQFKKPQILARVRALAAGKRVRGIVFRAG